MSLSEDHIRIIIFNLLQAVNHLHVHNVVHRDLKPGNILMNSDCNIKLCDFGLARTVLRPDSGKSKTNPGYKNEEESDSKPSDTVMSPRVGSRFYRAPELIMCHPDYGFAVDIWATGCILGDLLLNFVEIDTKDAGQMADDDAFSNKYLFPGDSCYPLSPYFEDAELSDCPQNLTISEDDQLLKIFEILGSPQIEDFDYMNDNNTNKQYLYKML